MTTLPRKRRSTPNAPQSTITAAAITYGELKRDADALAGFLQQRCGVAKGERVLLYLQNCPQFIIAYYAVLRADAVVVPVNPMNRTEELRHYVDDAQASVAIVGQELFERIAPLSLPQVIVATYSDFLRAPSDPAHTGLRARPLHGHSRHAMARRRCCSARAR